MVSVKVLIACECSGEVRRAFRALGHDAWSADLQPADDGDPHHFCGDVVPHLAAGWDLMIGHPPCTHLAVSGAKHFHRKEKQQLEALNFVRLLMNAPVPRICIENPVSVISTAIRKPDQIIQPWQFGDQYQKTTCLWLKNLPPLVHQWRTDLFGDCQHVERGEFITTPSGKRLPKWYSDNKNAKNRSKTFPGIARQMAEQWGRLQPMQKVCP